MIDINLEKQLPVITMNYEEVEQSLLESIKKYRGLIATEETLKDVKILQKELSSLRIKLDNFRKDTKKEMSKPIDEAEDKLKKLIAIVVSAENPLKDIISVFDDKKRVANKRIAEDIISNAIAEHQLNEKYAKQLTVTDKYCQLTAKATEVKNDIDQRCYLLVQQQEQEIETLQIMKDTIENINKNIDAKLDIKDFQSLIDMNYSSIKIMAEINSRGERIKAQELKAIKDKAEKAEKEVQERIARAEREAVQKAERERKVREVENERLIKLEIDKKLLEHKPMLEKQIEDEKIVDVDFKEEVVEKVEKVIQKDEKAVEKIAEPIYFMEIRVEATVAEIIALGKFLKGNNYNYKKLVEPTLLEVKE